MRTCKVITCHAKHFSLGYCGKHYQRFKKYGNPLIKLVETHHMTGTTEYVIWQGMRRRCYEEDHRSYKNYGGRGITVCDRWLHSFNNFYKDMGNRPFLKAQIDRIDNNKGYSKYNCEWVTPLKNMRHTSSTKLSVKKAREIRSTYKDTKVTQKELGYKYNVSIGTINDVIRNRTWEKGE